MKNEQSDKVFTSGEVARICGVSPDTVSRWFDVGHIEGYRLGPGGDRRIPYQNLRKFMLQHGIPLDRLENEARCILVVDDDPHYLDILPRALAKLGTYEILIASSGFDAGTIVAERNPRVLILDIHLADMDGRKVCQRVKARPETQHTRVIAISGYIEAHEFDGLRDFGFDDYLRKPFSIEELTAKIQAALRLPDAKVARPVTAG